ncbi:MAG: UvrD-helicase domain-containing protein [Flavobacteriales bacterium]|nr:UvrD-helicase domain-containing protein [Flavobacteriales bacterium]
MQNYLSQLNDSQKEAVITTEGPLMVIAGAGSGKTRVLTYRIAHLIEKGVDPFTILALTFTNKAAREMKERIAKLVGDSEAKSLWMGTFHSVFARILRSEAQLLGYPSNFTIYDAQDALSVIKKVIKDLELDTDIYKPKQVLGRISQYKNNLITVRAYFNTPELIEADASSRKPKLGEVYRMYVERCFKNGAMDFDDLLLRTNEILTRFPEVLAKYQNRFRYILVDEYQDTNHSQYLIVKALASRFENLCVVGDDAQSIYAFRGANIANILNFQSDYPDAKSIALEQNYRSTKNIVNAANTIIKHNKEQLDKNVWTSNEQGEKIQVYRAFSDTDEANFIANTVFESKLNHQQKNSDFAILYRTNAQSRAIEDALRKKNIPYQVFGGISFYQRKEIKDLLAYLRVLVNPKDEEALLRIINYPARGIGDSTLNKLIIASDEKQTPIYELLENINQIGVSIGLNKGISGKLSVFWEMIKSFKIQLNTTEVHELAMQIATQTGMIRVLKEDNTPESISKIENINELVNSIQGFIEEQKEIEDGVPTLEYFMENITLASDVQGQNDEDADKVSLLTVHLAKGLEFPVVFVAGMEEDLFPSMMASNTRQELEEERRLFYVALTRSEKKAYLSYAITRFRWGKIVDNEPSRFIEEIDEQYVELLNQDLKSNVNRSGLSNDIFGDFSQGQSKPQANIIPKKRVSNPQNLKPIHQVSSANTKENLNIKVGDSVVHDRFGRGEVEFLEGEKEDAKVHINFDNAGKKKLLLRFAKLRIV